MNDYSDTDSSVDDIPDLGDETETRRVEAPGPLSGAAAAAASSAQGGGSAKTGPSPGKGRKQVAPAPAPASDIGAKPRSAPLAGNTLGTIGFKWRVRIVRVYDSEEQWKGVVEIYFHWNLDRRHSITRIESIPEAQAQPTQAARPRRMSVSLMTNPVSNVGMDMIDEPKHHPVFLILNDEESHCTEEVYYKVHSHPTMLFGYVSYTVAVHERLELEVSNYK
jgi:hypothetical protein